jgi:hypothetical protein
MSNKRKLNQLGGRTLQHRQGRGRHREPGTTIADLVAMPGQVGAKILAAGALGSAAMMVMQPGVTSAAGGTPAPTGVTSSTLTADVSANQTQSNGGGIPTNAVDLLGIPASGLSPLPQASPGNPTGRVTVTVPFSTDGLGTPSVGIQGSISPANTNNGSLFGLGPPNSVGGAIPFSLNSSTFSQSPTATQPTFSFTKPSLNQILATDPELSGLINNLSKTQTPTFDLPQLPTLQEIFPNAVMGANSANSLTPGQETSLQQQINQAFGAPQGQDGALTPQQLIDQAFSAFPAQTGQQPAPGQQLTPQQQFDQTFSTLQAQNGQTPISDFGSLLGTSSNLRLSGQAGPDAGSLLQVAEQAQPGQPQIRNDTVTVIDENGNAKDLPLGSGQGQFSIDNPAVVNPGTVVPIPGGGTGTLQPGDALTILPNPNTGFPGLKIITPQLVPQGDNSNGTGNPVQVAFGDPLQAFAAGAVQDRSIAASLTPQDQSATANQVFAALTPPGQQPSPAPSIPAFADQPPGAAIRVVDTANGPAIQYDPGDGSPAITYGAGEAVPVGDGKTLVTPGTNEFGQAPVFTPNPNAPLIPSDQINNPMQETPVPIPVPRPPDPINTNPFEPPTGNDNTRFAMNTSGNTAQDQPPAPAPAPVVQDQPPAPAPAPVVQDQPPAPAPAPVAQGQPPAPAPVVQDQPPVQTVDPTGQGDPAQQPPPAPAPVVVASTSGSGFGV